MALPCQNTKMLLQDVKARAPRVLLPRLVFCSMLHFVLCFFLFFLFVSFCVSIFFFSCTVLYFGVCEVRRSLLKILNDVYRRRHGKNVSLKPRPRGLEIQ